MRLFLFSFILIYVLSCNGTNVNNSELPELNLSNKNLTSLPDSVFKGRYKYIDISFNQLSQISSAWIKNQSTLKTFNADFNNLTTCPFNGISSKSIDNLSLQANKINEISKDIFLLQDLKELNLKENEIAAIPNEFWRLNHIQTVKLSFNYIKVVAPDTINYSIVSLDLQSNQIEKISAKVFEFPNLKILNLADNEITHLPIDTLPEMDMLVLTGNPIPKEEKERIMKCNPEAHFIMW